MFGGCSRGGRLCRVGERVGGGRVFEGFEVRGEGRGIV